MNPSNVLRELARIYRMGQVEERKWVREEAAAILGSDCVLSRPPFLLAQQQILKLLAVDGPLAKSKEEGEALVHLSYFMNELGSLLKNHYLDVALKTLRELASVPDSLDGLSEPWMKDIRTTIGNLLSILIDSDASIESLYKIYAEILFPRHHKGAFNFDHRLAKVEKVIMSPHRKIFVVLALDNVSEPGLFPSSIGEISFSTLAPVKPNPGDVSQRAKYASEYLIELPRRLFAALVVESRDPRSAGALAYKKLNEIWNLVRFEHERAKVEMPENFVYAEMDDTSKLRCFALPGVVPNPSPSLNGRGLEEFVRSVNELVSGESFLSDGRDRVHAAFRLYRTGLDTAVLENKLVNWWTALEYLVRGANGGTSGGIGKSVENLLAPVLSVSYIYKHLAAFKSAMLDLGVTLTDPVSGLNVALKPMNLADFYLLIRRPDMLALINEALKEHPFFRHQVSALARRTPEEQYAANVLHERGLRWQLQRIWRARCDIVHSAELTVSPTLLCANLEYYLKVTLHALLKSLATVQTLSGPKEFFHRQELSYRALQEDLNRGSNTILLDMLAR